ncbi:conserved hypothetical protein [Xenorhabdus bovienii str. Jollieti]|uniref:Uncharacterized protein n=1 Tax=Xenorhabdus bovienii (strain SS-2004) TaxID=406818 RepID=D3V1F9_XENBS|nr:hypothetical protein [Xenorhabdus bovienii]CBJ81503.1 conserved hypothetical protein [Xenorhabdus bovienii SS-2004]CDH27282.1 conserved hypothetical protein [Xenorhabdus bovienii str. Jollieti]
MSIENININEQKIGKDSVVLGHAEALAIHAVAIGASPRNSKAISEAAIAIGQNQLAGKQGDATVVWPIAIGADSVSSGLASIALGQKVTASASQAVAIGQHSSATEKGSVALGADSIANKPNVVSVGKSGHERKIVHVAVGDISNHSTDAVNGQQLYSETAKINVLLDEKNKQLENRIETLESNIANLTLLNKNNADDIELLKQRLFDALNY